MIFERITMLQMEYFMAVATYKNFTKAARSLYVSQPSLSKQVAQLEYEVGVKLFVRSKKGVILTDAGTVLFRELIKVKQQLRLAFERARCSGSGSCSVICIGCLDAMDTNVFLPPVLDKLKKINPFIEVSLERHSFKDLRKKLVDGLLDVVFTLSFEIDSTFNMCSKPIYRSNLGVFMPSTHPLASKDRLSVADLADEKFVMVSREESPQGSDTFIEYCRKHGFSPNIVKQLPNPESILLSVEAGVGISCLDSAISLRNRNAFRVFEIAEEYIEIVMVWKKEDQAKAELLLQDE